MLPRREQRLGIRRQAPSPLAQLRVERFFAGDMTAARSRVSACNGEGVEEIAFIQGIPGWCAGGNVCEELAGGSTALTHVKQFDFRAPAQWVLEPYLDGWMQGTSWTLSFPESRR